MPRTVFTPPTDGFAFVNTWTLDSQEKKQLRDTLQVAVTAAISILNPVFGVAAQVFGVGKALTEAIAAGVPSRFGLCGGMAVAASDYYRTGILIPRGTGPNDQPTRATSVGRTLRDYLWQRQIESLIANAPSVLAWLAVLHLIPREWPFFGGHPWLRDKSWEHWHRLKGHIDSGEPWPIVLIGNSKDPFAAHVVLAYGYDDQGDGTGTISLYDMNCPGKVQTTRLDFRGRLLTAYETCSNRAGWTPLRGFFCYSYSPVSPPDLGLRFGGLQRETSIPQIHVLYGGAKFPILSAEEFNALGFSKASVRTVPDGTLSSFAKAPRDQTLLRERSSPEAYVVYGRAKFRLPSDEEVDNLGLVRAAIRTVPDGSLGQLGVLPRDGTLLRERSNPDVYLMKGGTRRHVTTAERFEELGLSWLDIRVVPDGALAVIPEGSPEVAEQELILEKEVTINEADADIDTGIEFRLGDRYEFEAWGQIWAGVAFTGKNGPNGWNQIDNDPKFPLHDGSLAHPYCLLGAFEGLRYFFIGAGQDRRSYMDQQSRRLKLRINDDKPGNGNGAFICRVRQWR